MGWGSVSFVLGSSLVFSCLNLLLRFSVFFPVPSSLTDTHNQTQHITDTPPTGPPRPPLGMDEEPAARHHGHEAGEVEL